jgi:hypothetical protein
VLPSHACACAYACGCPLLLREASLDGIEGLEQEVRDEQQSAQGEEMSSAARVYG